MTWMASLHRRRISSRLFPIPGGLKRPDEPRLQGLAIVGWGKPQFNTLSSLGLGQNERVDSAVRGLAPDEACARRDRPVPVVEPSGQVFGFPDILRSPIDRYDVDPAHRVRRRDLEAAKRSRSPRVQRKTSWVLVFGLWPVLDDPATVANCGHDLATGTRTSTSYGMNVSYRCNAEFR